METDLRAHPPRRWNESIEGVTWLPRLIDKARAYDGGTLGGYLFGQSVVDASFLRAAGFGYPELLQATRAAASDAGVLTELERSAPGATDRMRQWSEHPSIICRSTFALIDADEGHGQGLTRILSFIPGPLYSGYTMLMRRMKPLRSNGAA